MQTPGARLADQSLIFLENHLNAWADRKILDLERRVYILVFTQLFRSILQKSQLTLDGPYRFLSKGPESLLQL